VAGTMGLELELGLKTELELEAKNDAE